MATVGSILGGAVRLVRERPGSIAIWAVTYFVGSLLLFVAFGLLFMGGAIPFASPPPVEPPMPSFSMFWAFALLYLAFLLLIVVLMNAVFRAVLWPDERRGFASMQLGMDELRMLGLIVLVAIVAGVAVVLMQLLLLFLASLIGFASGGNGAVAGIFSLVLGIAWICLLVWVWVRLSVLFPLTLYRRRISLDAAWELTSGRFWTLFLSFLVVWLATIAIWLVLMSFLMGDYFAAMIAARGDPQQMQLAAAAFAQRQFDMPLVTRILVGLVGAAITAISIVMGPGVQASATRQLLIERGEAPESEEEFAVPDHD